MASGAANVSFGSLTPAQLRQWVEDHPGRMEDLDSHGETALYAATAYQQDLALVQWTVLMSKLGSGNINETVAYLLKDPRVRDSSNATSMAPKWPLESTALHLACSYNIRGRRPELLRLLVAVGANPYL